MKFLTKKSNAYIWNMAGGMLYAFQSVILLMVITRTVDLYSAEFLRSRMHLRISS